MLRKACRFNQKKDPRYILKYSPGGRLACSSNDLESTEPSIHSNHSCQPSVQPHHITVHSAPWPGLLWMHGCNSYLTNFVVLCLLWQWKWQLKQKGKWVALSLSHSLLFSKSIALLVSHSLSLVLAHLRLQYRSSRNNMFPSRVNLCNPGWFPNVVKTYNKYLYVRTCQKYRADRKRLGSDTLHGAAGQKNATCRPKLPGRCPAWFTHFLFHCRGSKRNGAGRAFKHQWQADGGIFKKNWPPTPGHRAESREVPGRRQRACWASEER